jgi:LysM repeat protein
MDNSRKHSLLSMPVLVDGPVGHTFLIIIFQIFSWVAFSQPAEYKMTRKEYIEKFKDDAVKEMLITGIPASIKLGQGLLESGNGNSALAVYANNHFGIKCHKEWDGLTYYMDDDEKGECFRKYSSPEESYSDHSNFLKTRTRYSPLFELRRNDYRGWARGLQQAGYATDPSYSKRLIEVIERNKLYELDNIRMMPLIAKNEVSHQKLHVQKPSAKKILYNNRIKFVIARPGDTFLKIAKEYEMGLWQLYKYNELPKNAQLNAGDIVYLQPKRRKAQEEFHIVKKGETMHSIAQFYGIKLKYLYRKNQIPAGQEPKPGDKLFLKRKKTS